MEQVKVKRFIISALVVFFFMASMGAPSFKHLQEENSAIAISGSTPQACVGFDSVKSKWGYEYQTCPANHAIYGGDYPEAVCCPLPSNDILTTESIEAKDTCPTNYIATGTANTICGERKCTHTLRCSKINTERYQLGEMKPSLYWGDAFNGWQGAERISWSDIPASIRFAMGRTGKDTWNSDGCVGYPWGSLLTKRTSGFCREIFFQELQFSGLSGDPQKGTPVKMLPDCQTIDNSDSPDDLRCHG